jgi:peptide methionine sulfoxide reductase MsrA
VGTQYRSIILAESDGMLDRVRAYVETLRPEYAAPIVTQIRRLD